MNNYEMSYMCINMSLLFSVVDILVLEVTDRVDIIASCAVKGLGGSGSSCGFGMMRLETGCGCNDSE